MNAACVMDVAGTSTSPSGPVLDMMSDTTSPRTHAADLCALATHCTTNIQNMITFENRLHKDCMF